MPSPHKCRSCAAEDHDVKFFRLRLLEIMGNEEVSVLFMRLFLSERLAHALARIDLTRSADDAPSSDSP
jgi:hypothetical protein